MKTKMECKVCKKEFEYYDSTYPNKKFCSNKCKCKYFKKHKISAFYNPKIQSENWKKATKKITETNRKDKKCAFFNLEIHRKVCSKGGKIGGKIGGLKASETNRKNKPYIFNSIHFDSIKEMEFGRNIHHQIEKLKEGKNCHIKIGSKTFDFFVIKYNLFVEFHPWDGRGLTNKQYHQERRDALNKNGYKNYPLIVIK